jgi:beta-fructofuranosidase
VSPSGRDADPRPRLHFTAGDGWINDPYGVTWDGARYHLFYQSLPGRLAWEPDCQWGHATSADLVTWTASEPALVPHTFEVGCWSGSVAVDDRGMPRLLYTRILPGSLDLGQVAIASGDQSWQRWDTAATDTVIAAPEPGLGVTTFRDPYVFRFGERWHCIVGAGLDNGVPAALRYVSDDLCSWNYDGVLCTGTADMNDVWTGSVWECPQLIRIDDAWVLVVSVWAEHRLHYVASSVGEYDGRRFSAGPWTRLTFGDSAYASSAFHDGRGRPCVISWLREELAVRPKPTAWSGAHSLVSLLTVASDGTALLSPHPNLESLRWTALRTSEEVEPQTYEVASGVVELHLAPDRRSSVRVVDGSSCRLELSSAGNGLGVDLVRPGTDEIRVPASGDVRLLLDADVIEVWSDMQYNAHRIPPSRGPSDQVRCTGTVSVRSLPSQ